MIKLFLPLIILLSVFIFGCQSAKKMNAGIQPGYEAVNPAAIIAAPIFIVPDPSSEFASIDPSVLINDQIVPLIESKIIESFQNQPINGYPFSAVKKAIDFSEMPYNSQATKIEAKKKNVWDDLNATMQNVAARFSSRKVNVRLLISANCLARKNFVEFYSFCLAGEPEWLKHLNLLSARVLNADSALIVAVTNLKDNLVDNQYEIFGGVAVMLVDTNNGKLIWGNFKNESIKNPSDVKFFPKWENLMNKIFDDNFWESFPGRIGKNQLDIE